MRERAEEFLKEYYPQKLTYEERLALLKALRQELEGEEAPLLSFQRRYRSLIEEIEGADREALKELHGELTHMALEAFEESRSVREVQGLCSDCRGAIARRLLLLVEGEMEAEGWGPPPSPYAWMAMGSEGRREETLYTDQDNLLVYRWDEEGARRLLQQGELLKRRLLKMAGEPRPPRERDALDEYFEVFSEKMVQRLEEVGIRRCKGGVMPVNEKWRADLEGWKERIAGKVSYGRGPLTVLDLIILMDLRFVGGHKGLAEELIDFANAHLVQNRNLVNEMASSAILIPLPLGLFRRFVTEKTGEHKGKINLKLGGWAPLVLIVRVMAKTYGVKETNTFERIKALEEREILNPRFAMDLQEALYILMKLRISHQRELLLKGLPSDDNYIDPYKLPEGEQKELRFAIKKVEELQKLANEIYFGGGFWR